MAKMEILFPVGFFNSLAPTLLAVLDPSRGGRRARRGCLAVCSHISAKGLVPVAIGSMSNSQTLLSCVLDTHIRKGQGLLPGIQVLWFFIRDAEHKNQHLWSLFGR